MHQDDCLATLKARREAGACAPVRNEAYQLSSGPCSRSLNVTRRVLVNEGSTSRHRARVRCNSSGASYPDSVTVARHGDVGARAGTQGAEEATSRQEVNRMRSAVSKS